MLLYLLYLLQLLNITYFLPLKHIYNNRILALVYNYVIYITKENFLLAFKAANNKAFIENNIYTGFRGTKLVPLNLNIVILKLNIRLCMLVLPTQ